MTGPQPGDFGLLVDQIYLDADLHMFNDGRWPGYVSPAALRQVLTGPKGA